MADEIDDRRPLLRIALGLAIAATITPLLVARYLPFTDLPEHVAAMATIARVASGDPAPAVIPTANRPARALGPPRGRMPIAWSAQCPVP